MSGVLMNQTNSTAVITMNKLGKPCSFCARLILADRLGLHGLTHLGYCLFQVEYETYESKPTLCLKRHMNFLKKVVCYQLEFEKVLPML